MTRILVILTGSLGDLVRGLALAKPLSDSGYEVHWLVEDKWLPIVKLNPYIKDVVIFERKNFIKNSYKLVTQIRINKYDIVLDLQRNFRSGCFSFFSGAKRRIGFNKKDCKEFNYLFNTETIPYGSESIPKIEHYMMFAEKLGINDSEIDFGIKAAVDKLEDFFGIGRQAVVLVLGSTWESKDWFKTGYYALSKLILNESDSKIVLLGDRRQLEIAQELTDHLDSKRVVNLIAKTDLLQLCQILNTAKLVVGPDSGPAHIAGALQKSYYTLMGPTDSHRVYPWNNFERVIKAELACMPCYRKTCPGLNRLCMRLIDPKYVFEQIKGEL